MKFLSFLFLFFLTFTMGYSSIESENHVEESEWLGEQIGLTTLALRLKYNMELISGAGFKRDGLDVLLVMFEKKSIIATQEEARAMIIDCIHAYLKVMNLKRPFTEKNLDIAIVFGDPESLTGVALERGIIQYTQNICNTHKDKFSTDKSLAKAPIEETYEKALELLHIQKPVF
jgi:hypothetical protein